MYSKKKSMYPKTGTSKTDPIEKDAEDKKLSEGRDDLKSLVEKYVADALKSAKELWEKDFEVRISKEREDAAKLATMSSEERARVEMDRRRKSFESEREQYMSERAEFEAAKELAANGLSVNFASMVADPDRETMLKNIEILKTEYMKAIEQGLSERLRGKAPNISREKEAGFDPFLSGLGM